MNIVIANRLVELRKKNGLSQEELAAKLGLSRQAVSKWERAEASPDTDNLICLAKLYNVSLDDLLNTDQPIEEIVKETKEINEEKTGDKKAERIQIDEDSIRVYNEDGSERFYAKDGEVHIDGKECKEKTYNYSLHGIVTGCLYAAVAAAYVLCGFLIGGKTWALIWPIFLLPIVIASIIDAVQKKKGCNFNYVVLITMIYCTIGMIGSLYSGYVPSWLGWHPWWVLYLTVPAYYIIFGAVDKANEKKRLKRNEIIIDNKDDLEQAKKDVLVAKANLKLVKTKYENLKSVSPIDEATNKKLAAAEKEIKGYEQELNHALEELEQAISDMEKSMVEAKNE